MAEDTGFLGVPHPHLRVPILYVVDIPKRVKWNQIAAVFKPCGPVTSRGRDTVTTNRGLLTRLTVLLQNVFQAEMALATLQGAQVPGTDPPFFLELSASPTLSKANPFEPLFPQYIRYTGHETELHPLQQASAQDIFTWFRRAGPLVAVRVNEDVGWPHPTCVLHYWQAPHAQHARLNCRALHPALKEMPSFALRTYDPQNLYCASMGASFTESSLWEKFSEFGQIVDGRMKKVGVPASFGFVSFATEEQARTAMKATNGTQLEGRTIIVRFHEPNNQAVFQPPPAARQAPKPENRPHPVDVAQEEQRKRDEALRNAQEMSRKKVQEEAQKKAREEAEKKARETERLRREEEKREKARNAARDNIRRAAAKREREKVERLAELARIELENAIAERQAAQVRIDDATQLHNDAKDRWKETEDAVQEAERTLEALKARRVESAQASMDAFRHKTDAEDSYRGANLRFEEAQKEDVRLRTWREATIREEAEAFKGSEAADEKKEEERRQAELAESIRKLKEIKEQEEADRQERLKREQEEQDLEDRRREAERLAQEERLRKEKEEKAQAARELLERRMQEERRQKAYQDASQRERTRCRDRDNVQWAPRTFWTKERAINRFKAVSTEFDSIKFCDTQPLTFESVPWPLVHSPLTVTLDDIEWSAVEEFFKAAKLAVDAAEYRSLVEKAHRRFHPDKWRARGLLLTVLDEDLRQRLEEAGNVVAQAITPLWLASKSKK